MSEDYPWYAAATDRRLEQGDLLVGCPLYRVNPDGSFVREPTDAIVLSHSCDLAND